MHLPARCGQQRELPPCRPGCRPPQPLSKGPDQNRGQSGPGDARDLSGSTHVSASPLTHGVPFHTRSKTRVCKPHGLWVCLSKVLPWCCCSIHLPLPRSRQLTPAHSLSHSTHPPRDGKRTHGQNYILHVMLPRLVKANMKTRQEQ